MERLVQLNLIFNADDILFTLLKETDINDHVNLLGKIDEKINNSLFKSDLDSVLLEIAKYKINKSIVHVINSFDFDIKVGLKITKQ